MKFSKILIYIEKSSHIINYTFCQLNYLIVNYFIMIARINVYTHTHTHTAHTVSI